MVANAVADDHIDEDMRKEAAKILQIAGLTIPDAVRMMLMRTIAEKALPFDPLVPNNETIEAMKAARRGELVEIGGIENLLTDLNADN